MKDRRLVCEREAAAAQQVVLVNDGLAALERPRRVVQVDPEQRARRAAGVQAVALGQPVLERSGRRVRGRRRRAVDGLEDGGIAIPLADRAIADSVRRDVGVDARVRAGKAEEAASGPDREPAVEVAGIFVYYKDSFNYV